MGREAGQGGIPRQGPHPQAHAKTGLNSRGQLDRHQGIEAQGIQAGLRFELSPFKAAELREQLRQAALHQRLSVRGLRQRLSHRLQLQHQRIARRSGLEIRQDHLPLLRQPQLQQRQGICRLQGLEATLVLRRHAAASPGSPVDAQPRQTRIGALLHQAIKEAIGSPIGRLARGSDGGSERGVADKEVVGECAAAAIQMQRPLDLGGGHRRTALRGLIG